MRKLTHMEIRKIWLDFFVSKKHKVVDSASLVPVNDPSLLWINAGVTPLKKYFDGSEIPESRRLTNIQKCIRTNDIENVGITKRHQTFFEMMGNFSIGDYFRDEAIEYSFELLTSEKYMAIPKEKLYVTIYTGDLESYNKWLSVGMIESHIIKLDNNFWEIGPGPCGPDSEIFYDRGEKYDDSENRALEKFKNDYDQERYVEIWNNVFSQYNAEEGVDRSEYKELPHKNIDTGAGLERWCMIMQDVDSSFETDLFAPIIENISTLANKEYQGQAEYKIIADHIRAVTFALADGASFSNSGRGYVLRRLLRRSVRAGKKLGINESFLYKVVGSVIDVMKEAYPYLVEKESIIKTKVLEEEKLFLRTLNEGEAILKEMIEKSFNNTLSGADSFKLYDTYGFPFELTLEYLEEVGYTTSKEEFDKYMESQKELARKSSRTKASMASEKQVLIDFKDKSDFNYGIYRLKTNVLGIFSKDQMESSLNHDGYIALKRTCLYATGGGQVNDTGMIIGKTFKARVVDVFKGPNGQNIHKVKLLDGVINVGDSCEVIVDKERRNQIEANHSSVHILHYILRSVIDENIRQAGSYVDNERLRLDFTYSGKLNDEDILKVEEQVNNMISKNIIVSTEVMPIKKAQELGAMALFTEKYGDTVRVVKIGKSMELCGGTHAKNTSDIKKFAIVKYESKGSDVYRIEATTGNRIEQALFSVIKPYNDEMIKLLMKAKEILASARKLGINLSFDVSIDNSKPIGYKDIIYNQNELAYVQDEVRNLEKQFFEVREKETINNLDSYKENIKEINGINLIMMKLNDKDMELLKVVADTLANEYPNIVIFFANVLENKSVNFLCRNNSAKINAGLLIKEASTLSGANGGGSPTFARGGGKDVSKIDEVFNYIEKELENA